MKKLLVLALLISACGPQPVTFSKKLADPTVCEAPTVTVTPPAPTAEPTPVPEDEAESVLNCYIRLGYKVTVKHGGKNVVFPNTYCEGLD